MPTRRLTKALSPGRPQLWVSDVSMMQRCEIAAACYRLLDPTERERNGRFRRDADRARDVLTRALVRSALSMCAGVLPECWRFDRDRHGRRYVTDPHVDGLHFSVSHAGSKVVCIVSCERDVGVDVEQVDPMAAVPEALSPRERASLRTLPESAFFSYWTLREAYCKATGWGLAGIGSAMSFELIGEHGATLVDRGAPAQGWWFHRLTLSPGYVLAVALRTESAVSGLVEHVGWPLRRAVA